MMSPYKTPRTPCELGTEGLHGGFTMGSLIVPGGVMFLGKKNNEKNDKIFYLTLSEILLYKTTHFKYI